MTTPNETNETNVTHLPGVSKSDIEARARAIAEQKLAERRAKELLKAAKDEGDDFLDKATDAVTEKATKAVSALRSWKQTRKEMREERQTRERAQEIAREQLIQTHMAEARRQLEEEQREAEETAS